MTKITKEWLQQTIAEFENTRDDIPFGLDEDDAKILLALKMALAGMEQEPVAFADPQSFDNFRSMGGKNAACTKEWMWRDPECGLIPLYAAPQPAVGNDFLPKNLDRALGVLGMALPESREEFNFQQERWIQRLIDRVIRCADELTPPLTDAERAELESVKAQLKAAQAHITELEAAPPAPVGPYEEPVPVMPDFPGRVMTQRECWQAGKAFGLAEGRKSPAVPDGYALVPVALTAENGAKACLLGEFSETKFINCPECFGDDECETCDGSGRIEIKVPVSWTNIKAIWAGGVEHFAAAPQQEDEQTRKK